MSGDDAQPPSPPDPIAPPAESPPAPPAEDDLPSGSLGTMNVKTLRKYAEVKGVDVSHCETRLELIRALSPNDLPPPKKRPSFLKSWAARPSPSDSGPTPAADAAGGEQARPAPAKKRNSFLSQEGSEAPKWVQGRRVSVRLGALPPELRADDDIEHCGETLTTRELPRHLLDDDFEVPSFDYDQLQNIAAEPEGFGQQATIHGCVVPRGQRAGRKHALKILRKELADSDAERKALLREVHFLARIRHDHIVEGLGCGATAAGLPCVLLEWLESDVMRAMRLKNVADPDERSMALQAWPSRERLRVLKELAAALDFLHSGAALNGAIVLHRDVKPENLGLTGDGRLKLLDFGLAVALKQDRGASGRYALTGVGSVRYMAPEVVRGETYGTAADVYSFAILAYELCGLNGRPFGGYDEKTHRVKVVDGGERPVLPARWAAALRGLLPRAWADDQDRRVDVAEVVMIMGDIVDAPDTKDPLPEDGGGCACTLS
ncbi:protein kinase [Aureococcus anophagefferens]|uniref:Protein kinase n=1 Tax=Aureococcus anophagefferens TaxID=44056 RepID=A0ABR1FXQ2_AURAN